MRQVGAFPTIRSCMSLSTERKTSFEGGHMPLSNCKSVSSVFGPLLLQQADEAVVELLGEDCFVTLNRALSLSLMRI